jgi:hypothetical protein
MSTSTRRVIARVSIAVDIAVLVALAVGVRFVHHGLGPLVLAMALPVVSALCGLAYLRTSKRGTR